MLLALHRTKLAVLRAKIMVCNRQVAIRVYAPATDKPQLPVTIHKVITSARTRTHLKRKHLIHRLTKCKTPSRMPSNSRTRRLCNRWQTAYRMDFHSGKMFSIDLKMLSNRYLNSHNRINRKRINLSNFNSLLINKHRIISKLIRFNNQRTNTNHISSHLKPINNPLISNPRINKILIKRRPTNSQSHRIHF